MIDLSNFIYAPFPARGERGAEKKELFRCQSPRSIMKYYAETVENNLLDIIFIENELF